jgi:molecular chaperone DnaK
LIYSVEKTFTEHKSKLGAAETGRIDAALEAAKQAVKGDDLAAIRSATSELQQASHAMAEALYQANQGAGGGPQAPQDHSPDVKEGEVVDA